MSNGAAILIAECTADFCSHDAAIISTGFMSIDSAERGTLGTAQCPTVITTDNAAQCGSYFNPEFTTDDPAQWISHFATEYATDVAAQ